MKAFGRSSFSRISFCIIASPVESYFKGEEKSVSVWIETEYSRAGPGGTGAAKCGGNYAASLLAQKVQLKIIVAKCSSLIWLNIDGLKNLAV